MVCGQKVSSYKDVVRRVDFCPLRGPDAPRAPRHSSTILGARCGGNDGRYPNTSDSNALGVWLPDGDGIKGSLVEMTANRTTPQFVSRGEISRPASCTR